MDSFGIGYCWFNVPVSSISASAAAWASGVPANLTRTKRPRGALSRTVSVRSLAVLVVCVWSVISFQLVSPSSEISTW